jgi:hypothetical protein
VKTGLFLRTGQGLSLSTAVMTCSDNEVRRGEKPALSLRIDCLGDQYGAFEWIYQNEEWSEGSKSIMFPHPVVCIEGALFSHVWTSLLGEV